MKKLVLIVTALVSLAGGAQAQTVTIDVDAGQLRSLLGTSAEPVGGLLELLASPSGTFSAPASNSYVTGDNVLVTSFAMNNNGGTAETFNALTSIPLTTSNYTLTAGEQLELRFYPALTLASMPATPGTLTSYGEVRSGTIEFGVAGGVPAEAPWVVPAAGSTINLEYITVTNGGTYANNTAYANGLTITAVPEPSSYVLLCGGVAAILGVSAWKRRNSACVAA